MKCANCLREGHVRYMVHTEYGNFYFDTKECRDVFLYIAERLAHYVEVGTTLH